MRKHTQHSQSEFMSTRWGRLDKISCQALKCPGTVQVCVYAQSLGRVRLCVTPWTVARQAPLSMGFSRQEHWSGLPCPPPGDLPNPGTEPASLETSALAGGFSASYTAWDSHWAGVTEPRALLYVDQKAQHRRTSAAFSLFS